MEEFDWASVGVSTVNASVVEANVLESIKTAKEDELNEKIDNVNGSISELNQEINQVKFDQCFDVVCVYVHAQLLQLI